jgi:hypothetical protein
MIYGALYLMLDGLFFGRSAEAVKLFPLPPLGVLQWFEGLALVRIIGDVSADRDELAGAVLVVPPSWACRWAWLCSRRVLIGTREPQSTTSIRSASF